MDDAARELQNQMENPAKHDGEKCKEQLLETFLSQLTETFLPYYHSIGIGDEKVMLHRFICVQAAFTNTVKYWVNNECSISVDEIAGILSECLHL